MRAAGIVVLLFATAIRSAINLDGSQAVYPVSDKEPSPIGDPDTYYPDQHDCPLSCVDYANVHSWTPYFSVERLQRCEEPLLLQFTVSQPLSDPQSLILIRSCSLRSEPAATERTLVNTTFRSIENPKTSNKLFEIGLNVAPACAISGMKQNGSMPLLSTADHSDRDGEELAVLLQGMAEFFDSADNCDESFIFAYHKRMVAGVYIGLGLGKLTASSALGAILDSLQGDGPVPKRTIAQVCDDTIPSQSIFGVSIDTMGNLSAIQQHALGWSKGSCADDEDLSPSQEPLNISIHDIAATPLLDNTTTTNGTTSIALQKSALVRSNIHVARRSKLGKRETCNYITAVAGDGCASLAAKCGIRGSDFTKFNPKTDLCTTVQAGDFVCCSAGDPYSAPNPEVPVPGPDGTCATHLIHNGDSCSDLAQQYGITVDEIESYNKGKTWAWTECKNMLGGYNMCLSNGTAPLPPPQEGTECGPLVPGTQQPNSSISIADLNPCPLKACCSNWGFCGPFPAHCDIHAPKGGGPGAKLPDFQSTCISNCGNDIKTNSGPPTSFQRVGYYESWNLDRDCLWMNAENSNIDSGYTHIHWSFAAIDPNTWKPILTDPHGQWDSFKKLENTKRIVSFGGWAYSTEAATYNILRSAIITNREVFATNLAQFVSDEGIDGVDIDWEYPGAPDILVDGVPIGQSGDGVAYLRFLTTLKAKLGDKSVSIAAPASYWYLKAFPIDRIAAIIDYIVYMTYDLHGQWDYGNVNAFDSCDSGKCIRSHVNLTETRSALSVITKAGVPNNKIFVGESSYGRSFHMAEDGCWGPMCEFTGTRTESDAQPGRCTQTRGYIANAEINEIIRTNQVQQLHDGDSNTDVLLYNGDYVSYMTPTTKDTRRADWQKLNFAGTIDWAVDLQAFGTEDMDSSPDNPQTGQQGCISGDDKTVNSGDLCEFTCSLGFCPESLCTCDVTGVVSQLPSEQSPGDIVAFDDLDVDLNRLCKFSCKYGYCPPDICMDRVVESPDDYAYYLGDGIENWYSIESARRANAANCDIWEKQTSEYRAGTMAPCLTYCQPQIDEAKEEDRTTSYGCVGFFPFAQGIPWTRYPGSPDNYVPGKCSCDNFLVNELADTIIEAMPIIAEIGCYIVMSSLKLVLDIGLDFIPGAGKALDAGLDMVTTAAQMASYLYPEEEDPEGAFSWWLSPCGGTDLVPDDIKQLFGILSSVADGVSSFKKPKNIGKGSGKKGDDANPVDRAKPKPGNGSGVNGTGKGKKKCKIPKGKSTYRLGPAKNTLRQQSCVADQTQKEDMIITSVTYGPQQTLVSKPCSESWSQACFHYSSAISKNPSWSTLTCPPGAATTEVVRDRPAVATYYDSHRGDGWLAYRNQNGGCDADEYPPAYLLDDTSPAYILSGQTDKGQLIRFLNAKQNRGAGSMWRSVCLSGALQGMSDSDFTRKFNAVPVAQRKSASSKGIKQEWAEFNVDVTVEFSISSWGQSHKPPVDDGISDNLCWPSGLAAGDPGFALLTFDEWYTGKPHPYDYSKKYVKGTNGS